MPDEKMSVQEAFNDLYHKINELNNKVDRIADGKALREQILCAEIRNLTDRVLVLESKIEAYRREASPPPPEELAVERKAERRALLGEHDKMPTRVWKGLYRAGLSLDRPQEIIEYGLHRLIQQPDMGRKSVRYVAAVLERRGFEIPENSIP